MFQTMADCGVILEKCIEDVADKHVVDIKEVLGKDSTVFSIKVKEQINGVNLKYNKKLMISCQKRLFLIILNSSMLLSDSSLLLFDFVCIKLDIQSPSSK